MPLLDDGSSSTVGGGNYTVAGWGRLVDGYSYGGELLPDVLHHAQVPLMSHDECVALLGGGIDAGMLCAGHEEGGQDACQGDSGGALFLEAEPPARPSPACPSTNRVRRN